MKRAVVIFLISFLLMACATAGKRVDVDAIKANVKIGETTKARLLEICGEPESSEYDAKNDKEILHYMYIEKNITPTGVVSHIVINADEWESKKTLVDVSISKGIVIDMKAETANSIKMHYK